MKFINDNDCILSYVDISGLKNGIVGYCDIEHALITANGWAVGMDDSYGSEYSLRGFLTNSTVNGNVSVAYDEVKGNTIDGNNVYLYEIPFVVDNTISGSTTILCSNIEGNTFSGSKLNTRYSFVYNNKVSSSTVYSYSDILKFVTYNGCTLHLGYINEYGKQILPSDLYYIQFNNCSFSEVAADIKNSNFINCGTISVLTNRATREKYICTGNYWGEINTVEIKSKGEEHNLSFITDYYDDFNKSRIDYSKYSESANEDAGYHGQEPDGTYSGLSIGDTGPAGGYVFYDKGYYSDGWRYLEAAPSNIGHYGFGYYRPDGANNNMVGTAQAIGSGRYNTERLVEHMDINGKTYSNYSGETTYSEYAAKKCLDYSNNGYDDWFLPSKDELNMMYQNLSKKGLGSFADSSYCSSFEDSNFRAWVQSFSNGTQYSAFRDDGGYVRPVRAF